jgi:hypothetical protein
VVQCALDQCNCLIQSVNAFVLRCQFDPGVWEYPLALAGAFERLDRPVWDFQAAEQFPAQMMDAGMFSAAVNQARDKCLQTIELKPRGVETGRIDRCPHVVRVTPNNVLKHPQGTLVITFVPDGAGSAERRCHFVVQLSHGSAFVYCRYVIGS